MKRAHLRRVQSVSYSPSQVENSVEQYEQTSPGVKRKKRTSAAMIGLALSMGASSLLIPRQDEGATAAEPNPIDNATISAATSAPATAPAAATIEHVVTQGQTLWQLARLYKVDAEAIAATNALKPNEVIKVGQVIRVPVSEAPVQSAASQPAPQLVASADLNRLPVQPTANSGSQAETAKVERNVSLDRLRQQQEKLRNSLAELRTKDQAKADAVISSNPPQLVAATDSNTDWLGANEALTRPAAQAPALISNAPRPATSAPRSAQAPTAKPATTVPPVQQIAANPGSATVSYQVSPGDTVAQIARAHNISPSVLIQTNRISDPNFIFVGQVLRVPAPQAARATVPQAPSQAALPQATNARLSVVPAASMTSAQPDRVGTGGSFPGTTADSGRDPHVENLLSEIRVLRERHRASSASLVSSAPAPQAVQPSTTLPSLSVGTQFNPNSLNPGSASRSARSTQIRVPAAETPQALQSQPQQVAAAPAGANNYAPLLEPVTGRMVSPDLPPLQGEDNFLPEGSPSFNGYIWPSKGELTSGYGWRWGRMHAGIDIAADIGTPIFAAADGVIEFSGWNSGGYGNLVEIRHPDGSMTRYAHLNATLVQDGQKVKQGEQIGEMGSTGYSTGPHLHFEVHAASDGGSVDPIAYLPRQ